MGMEDSATSCVADTVSLTISLIDSGRGRESNTGGITFVTCCMHLTAPGISISANISTASSRTSITTSETFSITSKTSSLKESVVDLTLVQQQNSTFSTFCKLLL